MHPICQPLNRTWQCIGRWAGSLLLGALFCGCSSVSTPPGVQPVTGFEVERYLGKWYEIARLDHKFERGLEQVSAEYSRRDDGGLTVLNRGFSPAKTKWKEASGVAYFLGEPDVGSLKVSFFRPFYGGYHIMALDQDQYRYALVSGPSHAYLWILARDTALPDSTLKALLGKAANAGFATNKLIWVRHPTQPADDSDPTNPNAAAPDGKR